MLHSDTIKQQRNLREGTPKKLAHRVNGNETLKPGILKSILADKGLGGDGRDSVTYTVTIDPKTLRSHITFECTLSAISFTTITHVLVIFADELVQPIIIYLIVTNERTLVVCILLPPEESGLSDKVKLMVNILLAFRYNIVVGPKDIRILRIGPMSLSFSEFRDQFAVNCLVSRRGIV